MKRSLLAVIAALAIVLSSPLAAQAYGEPAGPNRVATGGSAVYTFENIPGDVPTIDVTVDGPGAVQLAASVSRTYAVSAGIVSVTVTFPTTGAYTVTGAGSGPTTGAFTHTLTVDAVVAAADNARELSATGVDALPYLWFGGGAVILGVSLFLVMVAGRRRSSRSTPS